MSPETTYLETVEEYDKRSGEMADIARLVIYDYKQKKLLNQVTIKGEVKSDFVPKFHKPGQCGKWENGAFKNFAVTYSAATRLSNVAFVNEDHIVYGLPGGKVFVHDVASSQATEVLSCESGVVTVDCFRQQSLLAVGTEKGQLYTLSAN
jgi:hypothetical protein